MEQECEFKLELKLELFLSCDNSFHFAFILSTRHLQILGSSSQSIYTVL